MFTEDLHSQLFYLKLLASRLDRWKDLGGYTYQFRCPYCGDSQRNKYRARGYVTKMDNLLMFKCHNCGVAHRFSTFLKDQDERLYGQYKLSLLNSKASTIEPLQKIESVKKNVEYSECVNVADLSRLHPAREYVKSRLIPEDKINRFYYTENLKTFCESINNYTDVPEDARLLLFETDGDGNIKIVVARALDSNAKKRYIVLRIDEDYPKIYGLSKIDKNKPLYVVEGPIDSLFIDNCVATIDSNLDCSALEKELDHPIIYVHDNEPRSPIIVNKIKKFIRNRKNVVIFDDRNNYKDINDMVLSGKYDINNYLKERTFKGIVSTLEFNKWSKC